MKVLMLSWEYPPKCVGGLSNHVYNLTRNLSKAGDEVHVITCAEDSALEEENDNGVFVHRVNPINIYNSDFVKWVMHLNFSIIERGITLIKEEGPFDVIHAHDWLSTYSAKVLKGAYKIPLVCTIHATEHGRNNGIHSDLQGYISSAEWTLTYESCKVIACSDFMRNQISEVHRKPWDDICIIPNGVDPSIFDINFDHLQFRRRFAWDDEKIVLYVGRHVFEKGIHLLVYSAPKVVHNFHNTKFVIVGKGPMTEDLEDRVRAMRLENNFIFTGYMDDESKNKLYKVADVAVFPSLYEPFGIVALEAMSAGCPVIVSDTGGLSEIVKHGVNGLKCINGSSDSIGDNILELLKNEKLINNIRKNAHEDIYNNYLWEKVAEHTHSIYEEVLGGCECNEEKKYDQKCEIKQSF